MKKHKNKIIAGVIILIVLAFVFWYGGNAPGLRGWNPVSSKISTFTLDETKNTDEKQSGVETTDNSVEKDNEINATNDTEIPVKKINEIATEENKPQNADNSPMTPEEKEKLAERIAVENNVSNIYRGDKAYSQSNGMIIDESTGKDKYLTSPVPAGKPIPIEPQDVTITDKELTCTLSVKCDTILKNISWLDKEKIDIVPENGIIFEEKTVVFYEGESVFNLLIREMKKNKIHMEFENTPIYNSAYIEGIANLYEFDCGELSGWMYKVNDWFPNYGCSRYQLKAGDRIEWVYTCDLGVDVGGYYATSGN